MMTIEGEAGCFCMKAPEGDEDGRINCATIGWIDSIAIRPTHWKEVSEAWQGPGRYKLTLAFWGSPGCWSRRIVGIELVDLWLNYRG